MKTSLEIITTAEGKETKLQREATCEFGVDFAKIYYQDGEAYVCVTIEKGKVEICRTGDYGMKMAFKEKEITPVSLEIGGSVGEITAETYRLGYLISDTSCLLHLHYALLFSEEEKQEISLRLHAKRI